MDNKREEQGNVVTVPYVVYRDAMAHNRWVVKGLVIALLITIVLMFVGNAIWLWYWNQFDYTSDEVVTTVDSEGDGIANYTGGDGGVIYGEGNGTQDNPDTD